MKIYIYTYMCVLSIQYILIYSQLYWIMHPIVPLALIPDSIPPFPKAFFFASISVVCAIPLPAGHGYWQGTKVNFGGQSEKLQWAKLCGVLGLLLLNVSV